MVQDAIPRIQQLFRSSRAPEGHRGPLFWFLMRVSISRTPLSQPTDCFMYVVAVRDGLVKWIESICCTGKRGLHSGKWNILFYPNHRSNAHRDQRCSICCRQRTHRFHQPDGKFFHDLVRQDLLIPLPLFTRLIPLNSPLLSMTLHYRRLQSWPRHH